MLRSACVAVVALTLAWAAPAFAQTVPPNCAKRSDLLQHLSSRYKEAPIAMGVAANGGLLEVLTSLDGSTWTVAITMPGGVTCMIATGESWESMPNVAQVGPPA